MSVAKGFRLSDNSTASLDWNYVTKPDGTKSIIEEVNDVKQDLAALEGGGMSDGVKSALLACFRHVAFLDDDDNYYQNLYDELYPPANLVSISAVYTQSGAVYDTDSLDDLKSDLVVTAHYDDSSTQTITTYTLSGTLEQGTSTITVSYGGKTTTFDVTVSHVSETVTVPFSDSSLSPVTGKLIKADGTEATVSTGSYVALPYYEGMIITTVATSTWANYAFLLLYNGSTYTKVDLTDGTTSGTLTKYVTTLSGYSNIVSVYANYKTSEKNQCKYQYES